MHAVIKDQGAASEPDALLTRSEVARLLGPADWASPEAQAMVKALLTEK